MYDRTFWLAYAANVILVLANALTFRFAELIAHLKGNEDLAGDIVCFGLAVAVVVRFSVSHVIDNYGTRVMWLATSLMFLTGCAIFLLVDELNFVIWSGRALYVTGLTGMFACSMTHIQNLVPAERRTEIIGNLGSSGFIGMVLGSNLGDLILRMYPAGSTRFTILFGGALLLGLVYLATVLSLTRLTTTRSANLTPPAYRLVYRHWPGLVSWVAVVMGLGITVTTVFLTRFATQQGIQNIGTFFTGYAISAFVFRLSAQNWSYTIGRHWMLVRGLLGHAAGHALLPFITEGWQFVFPAVLCGFGHALLFPAVVSLGAGAFPVNARGTGTAVILGIVDFGSLVFSAILGRVIVTYGFGAMFALSSGIALCSAIGYLIVALRYPDPDAASHARPLEVAT